MGNRTGAPTADNGNIGLSYSPHTDKGIIPVQVWRMEVHLNKSDEADNRHNDDTGTPSATCVGLMIRAIGAHKLPSKKMPASAIF